MTLIEFFGEDEVWTSITNARILYGLKFLDITNISALLASPHPPVRNITQIPFQLFWGINEWTLFLPGIVSSLGIYVCLLIITRKFLSTRGMVFLGVFYTASAAYVINRSPNGHGWFILFLLLSFELIYRWRQCGRLTYLVAAWLFTAIATLTYLDGLLFVPYLIWGTFFTRDIAIGHRKRIMAMSGFLLPLGIYSLLFLWLPYVVLNHPVGNLAHLLERQSGITLFENNLARMGLNYYYTFNPYFTAVFTLSMVVVIARWKTIPEKLAHFVAFWVLHIFCWLFLFSLECGHTLYSYPLFLSISAWVIDGVWDRVSENQFRKGLVITVLVIGVITSVGYNYSVFNDPQPRKEYYGYGYFKDFLPCGVNYCHQIGLKSAAYLIRDHSESEDLFLGDMGGSMNLFYLDRADPPLSLDELFGLLQETPQLNIYQHFRIRYIGLRTTTPDFQEKRKLLDRSLDPYWIFVGPGGDNRLVIWDTLAEPRRTPVVIQTRQYETAFNREYNEVWLRFRRWFTK